MKQDLSVTATKCTETCAAAEGAGKAKARRTKGGERGERLV